jgi:TolB-like protein
LTIITAGDKSFISNFQREFVMNIRVSICAFVLALFCAFLSYGEEVKGNKSDDMKSTLQKSDKNMQGGTDKKEKSKESLSTLIVFDMTPEKGVEKGTANLLVEIIMGEIERSNAFKVIGQKDIDKMLFWETNKQLKNCTESSCIMQIAGAMGAEYYVESSIGTVGDNYVISMKLIETMKVEIKGRSIRTIVKDENKLIKEVKDMVKEVLNQAGIEMKGEEKGKPKGEVMQVRPEEKVDLKAEAKVERKGGGISAGSIITTAIGVGIIAGGVVFGLKAKDLEKKADDWKRGSGEDYKKIKDDYETNARIANYSFIGGGVVTAGGVLWMILSATSKGNNGERVSIYTGGEGFIASYRYNW